jgi:diguanylate cyclase (GGDEF)-like protein
MTIAPKMLAATPKAKQSLFSWLSLALHRPRSLRSSLALLVFLCVFPPMALSGYWAMQAYDLLKHQTYTDARRLSMEIMHSVENELTGIESGLKVLSSSKSLKENDLREFHHAAKKAVETQSVFTYVLTNRNGMQVANTLKAFDAPRALTARPEELDEIFTRRKTTLSGYFIGPVIKKPAISMGVPVFNSEDEVTYRLSGAFSPEKITRLIVSSHLPEGWIAAVIDASGTIVGRNKDTELYAGKPAVPGLLSSIREQKNGIIESVTKDGMPVFTAFNQSPVWGWSVAVGAPKALLEKQLRNVILLILGGLLMMLLIASAVSYLIIQRLTRSIDTLNNAALDIFNGKSIHIPLLPITEAQQIGHAIVKASELASEIQFQARHDSLTGLANRTLFFEFLEGCIARAKRHNEPFSLLVIDLDKFKLVNDQQGHAMGDAVLSSAAGRLQATVRAFDLAARLGGDEFGVVLAKIDQHQALEAANRIIASLSDGYEGCDVSISASIGIATWSADIKDSKELMIRADAALYKAKSRGGRAAIAH